MAPTNTSSQAEPLFCDGWRSLTGRLAANELRALAVSLEAAGSPRSFARDARCRSDFRSARLLCLFTELTR